MTDIKINNKGKVEVDNNPLCNDAENDCSSEKSVAVEVYSKSQNNVSEESENEFYHSLKTVAHNPELFGVQLSDAVSYVLDEITQLKFDNDNLNAGKSVSRFADVCEENKQLKVEINRVNQLLKEKDTKIENQRRTLRRLNDLYDEAATAKEINKAVRLATQLKPQIDRLCEITQLEKQSRFIKGDDLSQTDISYWDCDCDKDYIHTKADTLKCKKCGALSKTETTTKEINTNTAPTAKYSAETAQKGISPKFKVGDFVKYTSSYQVENIMDNGMLVIKPTCCNPDKSKAVYAHSITKAEGV
ncbi:hypothetical protein [Denitromonas sp.]|uniref:hypothetical protein n=1 Tax=Denitromonas sp. TaxID=2734609 RepID=UPI003A8A952D